MRNNVGGLVFNVGCGMIDENAGRSGAPAKQKQTKEGNEVTHANSFRGCFFVVIRF
jgi:hypothetical protein